jgi:hypothetical protein
LPYTTADMGERLAKKKAEQEAVAAAQANQALRFGVTNPPAPAPEPKKSGGGWLSQVGNMAKSLVLTPAGTLADMIPGVAMIPGVKGEGVWGYEPEDAGTTNFFQAGGQGLEQAGRRAVGDITAIKGIGKPSASPTAAGIRQKGWFEGLGEAVLDYGNLAATAAPLAGPAVKGIQGIRGAQVATEIPYTYGIHVSPTADLAEIQARQAMQQQAMAGDAMAGSSYMWDARSPQTIGSIFDNPQLNPAANPNLLLTPEELAALPQPNLYVTRAPAGQVVQDANVPNSSALRVGGNQEVLAQVPFDRASLQAAMEQYAGPTRSGTADRLESQYRGLNPTVKADIANRPYQLAEENLRQVISRGTNPYFEKNFPGLSKLDPNAPIGELLRDPDARKLFEEYRGIDPTKVESMVAPIKTPQSNLASLMSNQQLPNSLRGIQGLPFVPSRLNFADFQSMPEYQQYLQAGQGLPTAKELADFGFDPERAYMVHSGAGDLTGGVLDPNFTGRANPEVAALNNTQLQNVIAKTTRANAYVDELSKGLEEFNRTGIWNGAKIGSNISNRIKDYFTRLDFVDELALNENLTAAQLGQANTQRFIDRLNRIINSEKSYLDTFQQSANLAQQGNFLSMYPASVGTHNGYLFGEQPTTYLVGPNTNQITKGLGPGVFEPTAQVNVPEYQVFGQQSPLASMNYQPQFRPSLDQMAAARAFFLRKVIEDRIARGLYGQ